MTITVHAGHNPDGKTACGAVGILKESTEARIVAKEVTVLLKKAGHTVIDCTVNDGVSQTDVLKKIVAKCNAAEAELNISIHFNSGANDLTGDGKTTGTEVFIYNTEGGKGVAYKCANAVAAQIAELGFKNRGIKISKDLYVLRATKDPTILIECCFVDDKDDCDLYDGKAMAKAIADGILKTIGEQKLWDEEENEMIYNYIDENMPDWARATIQKLVNKGYIKGNEKGELGLNDTMLKILVINDRAGLYGK